MQTAMSTSVSQISAVRPASVRKIAAKTCAFPAPRRGLVQARRASIVTRAEMSQSDRYEAEAIVSEAHNLGIEGTDLESMPTKTSLVSLAILSGAVLLAAKGTTALAPQGAAFVHIAAYGVWLGTVVWTTLVAGLTMFKNLPRQTFGKLQSKLFPQYFTLTAAAIGLQLGALYFSATQPVAKQLWVLGLSLGATLFNLVFIEPATTASLFERYVLENAQVKDQAHITELYNKFGKLHGLGSLINFAVLVAALAHGWFLAGWLM